MTKTVNGKEVTYGDCVYTRITTTFSLFDRLRILFGKPLITDYDLYVAHEDAKIVGEEIKSYVPSIIQNKKDPKWYAEVSTN